MDGQIGDLWKKECETFAVGLVKHQKNKNT